MADDSFVTSARILNLTATVNNSFGLEAHVLNPTSLAREDSFGVESMIKTSSKSNQLIFEYTLTNIEEIIPDPAPVPGGVTIKGTLLDKVTAVYMDNKRTSFRKISSTEIWASIPPNVSSTTIEVYVEYEF